jgi:hypothetical protein
LPDVPLGAPDETAERALATSYIHCGPKRFLRAYLTVHTSDLIAF